MSGIEKCSNYGLDKEGNLVVIYYIPNTDGLKEINYEHYKLIKYDRESLLNQNLGLFRSIIFSNNKLVCYSPQKSISLEEFKSNQIENITIEEIIEGTMINLFYDEYIEKWTFASKSNIGANCKFYSNSITFHEMYEDCLKNSKLNYDDLDKKYCYSFVIQHPKNRIVVPFDKTSLYLVNIYYCYTKDNLNLVEYIDIRQDNIIDMFKNSFVKFPAVYKFDNYESITMPSSWIFKGYMLKTDFYRAKILNVNYEHIKDLRGNQPNHKYYYLMLRKNENILTEFLHYYPEFTEQFKEFEKDIKSYIYTLFKNYVSCFIHKKMKLRDYPSKYKPHMYQLHQIYITKLIHEKKYITFFIVEKYINDLHPSQLMYSLNYEYHEHDNQESPILVEEDKEKNKRNDSNDSNDSISNDYLIIS